MRPGLLLFIMIKIIFAFSLIAQDQCKITGSVYDLKSMLPVKNANVVVRGTIIGTTTDSLGHFKMELPKGKEYTIIFSHLGYIREIRELSLEKYKDVEYNIYFKEDAIIIPEVVINDNQHARKVHAQMFIDGVEFEKLGEDDMEKAMIYLLPDIVYSLRVRESDPTKNFTLYVNKIWKDSIFLDSIDPYSIKYIQVWKLWRSIDYSPIDMPIRVGNYAINIVTK